MTQTILKTSPRADGATVFLTRSADRYGVELTVMAFFEGRVRAPMVAPVKSFADTADGLAAAEAHFAGLVSQ